MAQIFDAVTTTCLKYGYEYLPYIAAVTVLFVAAGVALRVISRR
jgi:hypothetical protein